MYPVFAGNFSFFFKHHLSLAKLLVTTGSIVGDFARKSEVIDLNGGKTCDPLEDLSFGTMDGTGALLSDQFPLVCGGYVRPSNIRPTTNQCEVLGFPGIILDRCVLYLLNLCFEGIKVAGRVSLCTKLGQIYNLTILIA